MPKKDTPTWGNQRRKPHNGNYYEKKQNNYHNYDYFQPPMEPNAHTNAYYPPQYDERVAMHIADLKGRLNACQNKLSTFENDSLTLTMLHNCVKMYNPALKQRQCVNDLLLDEGPICKSIEYLFQDKTFHSKFDDILQNLDSMFIDCQKQRNYKKKIDRITTILRNIDLPVIKKKLDSLIDKLKEEVSQNTLKDIAMKSNGKTFSLFVTPYMGISNDFSTWKKDYLNSQKETDAAFKEIVEYFSKLSSYLSGLSSGADQEDFSFSTLNLQQFHSVCEAEVTHSGKMCIETLMSSLLEELFLRSRKIYKSEKLLSEFGLNSLIEAPMESLPPQEDDYPTLVKFISQSRTINNSTKCLVIRDIVAALCKMHSEGHVYKYLNPQNILMNEGAKLRMTSETCIYEPLLPWKFQAPECSGGAREGITESIGPTADCYSLGQLMLWLTCLSNNDNYTEKAKHLRSSIPMLSSLLSSDPALRPSVINVQENIDQILSLLIEEDDTYERPKDKIKILQRKTNIEETPATESVASAQSIEQEEEEILKELMYSDSDEQ